MAFKAVKGRLVLLWTQALIMWFRAWRRPWHELETTMAFWQDLVINEDAAVVDSAEDVLFWAVKRISHEELSVWRSSYNFKF